MKAWLCQVNDSLSLCSIIQQAALAESFKEPRERRKMVAGGKPQGAATGNSEIKISASSRDAQNLCRPYRALLPGCM
jgi:hypothetical protein